jgi:arylsulfatase A-like enzyme
MSARPLLLTLLVLGLGGAAALGWSATREREFTPTYRGTPPNLLFLSIDTLRADHMGVYGYERNTTPAIDAWAQGATVFEGAQASASWTLPGLASVLTSFYTSTHQCWTFSSRLDPSFTTLPEILTAAGFDTMCVTSHVFLARRYGLQQGFVHFDDEFAHPLDDPTEVVTSHMVSDKGIRFLEQKAAAADDVPWMLWLHYFDPHGKYNVHEGISEEFGTALEIDRYDGEVRFTDLHVGRVLAKLEELGLAEDTMVVFFSDHGEEFLDHGGLRHGHALYRELIRVPLIVKAPGCPPARVPDLVRTVDLMPTVLDFVPPLLPPSGIEGVSLRPMLERPDAHGMESLAALSEIRLQEVASLNSVIRGRWKLIAHSIEGTFELYDVEADPLETNDLADAHPDVVDELKGVMKSMIERARDRGAAFGTQEALGLTETQRKHMQDLGYLGDG